MAYDSLNLVLVEEEGVLWISEVVAHMVLCCRHWIRLFTRVLKELFQDVEKLRAILLLFLVFNEQRVVFKELLFSLFLIQVSGLWLTSHSNELLWLIVCLVDRSWIFLGLDLHLVNVPALKAVILESVPLVHKRDMIWIFNRRLVFLLQNSTVCHLLVKSILILDRLVVLSLSVWRLLHLVLV